MSGLLGPTTGSERIQSIDVLRGVAVLGILVMNIQAFSMIGAAYVNPMALGDLTGLNYMTWLIGHVLVEGKFLAIFGMLFGAGIVLMSERMEAHGLNPTGIYYRRILILLVLGVAHAWLLWPGDILYKYAMCGLVVYLFRNLAPKNLIILGILSIAVGSSVSILAQATLPDWPEEFVARLGQWWTPDQEQITRDIQTWRGSWSTQNELRFNQARSSEIGLFIIRTSWRAGGLMLAGMGLYKLGVFNATLAARTYKKMILAGLILGLPLIVGGIWYNHATHWSVEAGFFGGGLFNSWGSLPAAMGWVGLVMLFCQGNWGVWLKKSLAATGRMALTNYLMQTVICTTLFFGHGFGLYGSVDRTGQLLIVFAIWAAQLLWSPWWLTRFRFGPLEWAWRSLTYGRPQPMRKT